MSTGVTAVVLAAGKGSRMNSNKPKILHTIAGQSMLGRVLNTAEQISDEQIVVIGNQSEQVKNHVLDELGKKSVKFALQEKQLGTGHAVLVGLEQASCIADSKILILYGDVPLIQVDTLKKLINLSDNHPIVLLSTKLVDPTGYGRIVRDESASVVAVVEERDANVQQQQINEVSSGIMVVQQNRLMAWLNMLDNNNSQGEYYLPDILISCVAEGGSVASLCIDDWNEVGGVNNQLQRVEQERHFQLQYIAKLIQLGLGVADTKRLDIRGNLTFGQDVFVDLNVVISGNVTIGNNVYIGPGCIIHNCKIDSHCHIKAYSIIEDSIINESCNVGPYARIRPQTVLGEHVNIGNFVETKKSTIQASSKINHLSYVGDSFVGANVNVGAGTITCNYDGKNKHHTEIKDDAFIGSGTQLVAPVSVGKGVIIAAGSVVAQNVPDDALFVSRAKPVEKAQWAKHKRLSQSRGEH